MKRYIRTRELLLALICFGALSGCTFSLANPADVKTEINNQIAAGMSKQDAINKLSEIDFICPTSTQNLVNSITCAREEGFSNETITLSLSPDKTTIVKIGDPRITGMGP